MKEYGNPCSLSFILMHSSSKWTQSFCNSTHSFKKISHLKAWWTLYSNYYRIDQARRNCHCAWGGRNLVDAKMFDSGPFQLQSHLCQRCFFRSTVWLPPITTAKDKTKGETDHQAEQGKSVRIKKQTWSHPLILSGRRHRAGHRWRWLAHQQPGVEGQRCLSERLLTLGCLLQQHLLGGGPAQASFWRWDPTSCAGKGQLQDLRDMEDGPPANLLEKALHENRRPWFHGWGGPLLPVEVRCLYALLACGTSCTAPPQVWLVPVLLQQKFSQTQQREDGVQICRQNSDSLLAFGKPWRCATEEGGLWATWALGSEVEECALAHEKKLIDLQTMLMDMIYHLMRLSCAVDGDAFQSNSFIGQWICSTQWN